MCTLLCTQRRGAGWLLSSSPSSLLLGPFLCFSTQRAEARRAEALQIYLASTLNAKTVANKEVNIGNFSMTTPDGGTELLANAGLKLTPGRRYGLIGRNGVGKTTLMRFISNYEVLQSHSTCSDVAYPFGSCYCSALLNCDCAVRCPTSRSTCASCTSNKKYACFFSRVPFLQVSGSFVTHLWSSRAWLIGCFCCAQIVGDDTPVLQAVMAGTELLLP